MRKQILFFIGLILMSSSILAQSAKKAKKLLLQKNYPEAIAMYEKLVEKNPEKAVYQMNLGECYVQTPQKRSYAIPTLQKAISLISNKKKSETYIDAKFLLGKAYHANHKFDEAINTYNELVINKTYKKSRSIDILKNEIRACEAAKKEFKKRKKLKILSPGNGINNEFTQHSPFFIEDKEIFVYTSKEKTKFRTNKTKDGEYDENIFFISINNENDKEPDVFNKPINSKDNEASCWASKDGKLMFLNKGGDIYSSKLEKNIWSKPEKFKAINTKYNEAHASMSIDGNYIYFSSNRPGGSGGKDIYYIKKQGNSWSKAKNLGKKINTKFDEESPFIHGNGTLFFSSKGHNSIGGYDIFKAKGINPTKFEKAQNLGMPINTVEDDIFYFETSNNKKGYFMSKRPEGKGRGDIFMVNYSDSSLYFITVKGSVQNEDNSKSNIKISNIKTKRTFYNKTSDADGNFSLKLERDKNYFASLEADNHFFQAFTYTAPFNDDNTKDIGSYKLEKIIRGKVNKVYSLDFNDNKTELNNENYLFLNVLSDFMDKNKDLVVNISTSTSTNEKNAKERKQNIINYLKGEGVPENRIFVDLLNYKKDDKDVLITILDKQGAKNAFTEVVENNDTPITSVDDGTIFRGTYTIQLGAFTRKISKNHKFFKTFRGKVKIKYGADNLNHYIYGKYKYKSDAEKQIEIMHSAGFTDAFIRELEWYK